MGDSEVFAVSDAMSGALVHLYPGGMRQLHWHTNLDEWQFVINGTIQVRTLGTYASRHLTQFNRQSERRS